MLTSAMSTWAGIALGGALGSLGRYWLALWAAPISRRLPFGTIGINVLGSFVIAFFGTFTVEGGALPAPEPLRLFVTVGLCGGFTTFSSFSLQTLDLLRGGAWGRAWANVVLSVLLCLCSISLGYWAALQLNAGGPA